MSRENHRSDPLTKSTGRAEYGRSVERRPCIQGLFAGESMFTRVRDASKVALAFVMDRLNERGYRLFDVQYLNDHTQRLGAVEIPRSEYLRHLQSALKVNCSFA